MKDNKKLRYTTKYMRNLDLNFFNFNLLKNTKV